ncbi:hypothetical protein RDI58_009454 [Solanum bulbocastanum]|uniref:Uncharacterized protein n=1 Tax=Solanum bulbocastanum TaxID=147425 RepID=A0AAN8YJG0_SOLBU
MHAFMFEFYARSNWINCAAGIIGYCQHIKSFHLRLVKGLYYRQCSYQLPNGGFLAKVIVKAADSKVISKSKICESPREARESAAAHMISSFQK